MIVPLLSTRTTNVELTPKRRDVLKAKLFPLVRYACDTSLLYFDVDIKRERSHSAGVQYSVAVRLSTATNRYIATSTEKHFERALLEIRNTLKRQMREARTREQSLSPNWMHQPIQLV